tara:strand:+ start:3469 stop:4038 length:570 start_codon:yes stop_codon:yes gene_type:complete
MAIEILFEKETERKVQSLNQDELKSLAELCDKLLRLQGTIGNTEDRLQRLKEAEKNLSEEVIPLRLQELGIQDLRLNDGSRISAEPYYGARISNEKLEAAHKWLRKNGHGDLIKNVVSLQFGRGEDERAKEVINTLMKDGLIPEQKQSVHPSSLKAFVREQVQSNNQGFDQKARELFSVYEGRRTKIVK